MKHLLDVITLKGSATIELQGSTIEVFITELNKISEAKGTPTVTYSVVDMRFLGNPKNLKPSYLLTFDHLQPTNQGEL